MNYKFIAFTTKGLQDICISELKENFDSYNEVSTSDRHVIFFADFVASKLKSLRTVDDISLICDPVNLDGSILASINTIKSFRNVENNFSITVSSYKSDSSLKEEWISKVKKMMSLNGFTYIEGDHTNIDIRIILDKGEVIVAVKLFPQSLYVRSYGHTTASGSLRATIAASIIRYMREKVDGDILCDPFCGTGTFLCEGTGYGYEVFGWDIDENKVSIAKDNLNKLGIVSPRVIMVKDTSSESFEIDARADLLVANLPWGKQIRKRLSFSRVFSNMKKILNPKGGIAIITTDPQIVISQLKKNFGSSLKIEERKIGYIGQSPSIVFGYC